MENETSRSLSIQNLFVVKWMKINKKQIFQYLVFYVEKLLYGKDTSTRKWI